MYLLLVSTYTIYSNYSYSKWHCCLQIRPYLSFGFEMEYTSLKALLLVFDMYSYQSYEYELV